MSFSIVKNNIFLILVLFGICFQIHFFYFSNGSSVKLYHVLIPLLMLFLLFKHRLYFVLNDVFLFFCFSFSISFYAVFYYGWSVIFFQAVCCFLIYNLAYSLSRRLSLHSFIMLIRGFSLFFFLCVIIKDLVYFRLLSQVYSSNQEVLGSVFWFIGGGHNIEVTYISFLSVFFIRSKLFFYCVTFVLILSLIYLSRIGMIEFLMLIYAKVFYNKSFSRQIYYILALIPFIFFLISFLFLFLEFYDFKIFDRFYNIHSELENSNNGRGMLWYAATHLICQNFLGYGIGNAIPLAKDFLHKNIVENNFHNIYLQYILDSGFFSLIIYFYIILKRLREKTENVEFKIFIFAFSLVSFFQFTGYDIVFWFFLGVYDSFLRKNVKDVNTI